LFYQSFTNFNLEILL